MLYAGHFKVQRIWWEIAATIYVCVLSVCSLVCVREREGERHTQRHTQRHRHRERDHNLIIIYIATTHTQPAHLSPAWYRFITTHNICSQVMMETHDRRQKNCLQSAFMSNSWSYHHSFLPATICNWNCLPNNVIDSSNLQTIYICTHILNFELSVLQINKCNKQLLTVLLECYAMPISHINIVHSLVLWRYEWNKNEQTIFDWIDHQYS